MQRLQWLMPYQLDAAINSRITPAHPAIKVALASTDRDKLPGQYAGLNSDRRCIAKLRGYNAKAQIGKLSGNPCYLHNGDYRHRPIQHLVTFHGMGLNAGSGFKRLGQCVISFHDATYGYQPDAWLF